MVTNLNLADLMPAQGISILGANIGDGTGYSIANAGDFNGDGYPDFVIGSPNASPNSKTSSGISYIIYGASSFSNLDLSNLSSTQGFRIYGANAQDNSGYSLKAVGDINQDG